MESSTPGKLIGKIFINIRNVARDLAIKARCVFEISLHLRSLRCIVRLTPNNEHCRNFRSHVDEIDAKSGNVKRSAAVSKAWQLEA